MQSLEFLIERLVRANIEFVVVGGFAAVAHGVSLLTQDIDICCRFIAANLLKLQEALSGLHPTHRMTPARVPFRITAKNCRGLKNLYLDTDFGQLDCLGEVLSIGDFDAVLRQSIEVRLRSGLCVLLSLDALIKAKKAMNRPRDIEVVKQLESIRKMKRPISNPGQIREQRASLRRKSQCGMTATKKKNHG